MVHGEVVGFEKLLASLAMISEKVECKSLIKNVGIKSKGSQRGSCGAKIPNPQINLFINGEVGVQCVYITIRTITQFTQHR